ncbi:hypothetical protein K461DRAFT_297715 [Myriangium duriaei CBS 260.36]|uniref:Uncharacterized protein n=1 Tax=Myriangium duriaei CBS 260.36 TaxID=1168546 RepID=A0A9P4IQM6_9PEZI|nr:hypothetical protein K461DRAFT_297715 [Myriangium duriaei CBS 260.36]
MTPPHSIALEAHPVEPQSLHGYTAPTTPAEKAFADGSRSSPTKTHGRDEVRGAYRAQSIRAIQEANGDVDAFLEEVEAKRRQLDEQIHRYVKQKEREFKLFERDARIKHRSAGPARPDSSGNSNSPRAGSISSSSAISAATSPELSGKTLHPSALGSNPRSDRARSSKDREAEFVGVFTPSYLPLLNNKGEPQKASSDVTASTSAPAAVVPVKTLAVPDEPTLHRANSDPLDDKNAQKHRIKLEKRTSSSGSESRNLVSALKSPAAQPRLPKRKRVSLIVGDEVVAPSDNVAAYETANELARDLGYRGASAETEDDMSKDTDNGDLPQSGEVETDDKVNGDDDGRSDSDKIVDDTSTNQSSETQPKSGIASALANGRQEGSGTPLHAAGPEAAPSKAIGEDLFGFDDIDDKDAGDGDLHIENISDVDDGHDVSPTPSPAPPEDIPGSLIIPKSSFPPQRPTSQIRTLSSSSSQPVSPGFSRPSVTHDPLIAFAPDALALEREQDADYGLSASFLDRAGSSLGESFMERNAMELRKSGRRRSSGAS